MALAVGQKAPDFQLIDTARQPRKLSEFAGKTVVLAFFPGAFTGGCTTEACALRDSLAELNSLNAQVVGISVDSFFAQKAWADANNLQFPLLSDYKREVVTAYDVALPNFAGMEGYTTSQRAVFVIDKDGVIRHVQVTPTPAEQPDLAKVKEAVAAAT